MSTPRQEQIFAEMARKAAIDRELKGRILRAKTWNQLFTTPEEAKADFLMNIVEDNKREYESNNTLQEYRIDPNPEGDIHIFVRKNNIGSSTFQRLQNGDVVMKFHSSGDKDVITASVGNIDHPFTAANTVRPDSQAIFDLFGNPLYKAIEAKIGTDPIMLLSHLRGKPATSSWEEILLRSGYLPERIGHRIFPHYILEAQIKFAIAYPHLMPKTS